LISGSGYDLREKWRLKIMKKYCSTIFFVLLLCLITFQTVAAGQTKHIILFIGDGMQLAHEIAVSRYLFGTDYGLVFHDSSKFPYKTYVSTWDIATYNKYAGSLGKPAYSASSFDPIIGYNPDKGGKKPYPAGTNGQDSYFLTKISGKEPATDSASAATAWATGYKTDDGNIAWLPGNLDTGGNRNNDGSLKTIAELVREEKGMAIGVVSTVPFSHATPAAHVSHNKNRDHYYTGKTGFIGMGIADEIVTVAKPDVVIGGGNPTFDNPVWSTSKGYVSQSAYNSLRKSTEYVFVERIAHVSGGTKLLNAAETAKSAGKKLFGLFGGSGGNFESPVPTNDGSSLINIATEENPTLAIAVKSALKVLSVNPKGFFVMIEQGDIDWANHANDFSRMIGTVWDLNEAVKAAMEFVDQPGDNIDWDNTLLIVTSDHSNSYLRLNTVLKKGILPKQNGTCGSGRPLCTYPDGEVSYGTGKHTNELVTLYAKGAGSELFKKYEGLWYPSTSIIDNTHIFHVLSEAAGASARPLE
jgi:alkaline phosphatase